MTINIYQYGIDITAWIPDPDAVGLSYKQAMEVAILADRIQSGAHGDDIEALEECRCSNCWVYHLDAAARQILDLDAADTDTIATSSSGTDGAHEPGGETP